MPAVLATKPIAVPSSAPPSSAQPAASAHSNTRAVSERCGGSTNAVQAAQYVNRKPHPGRSNTVSPTAIARVIGKQSDQPGPAEGAPPPDDDREVGRDERCRGDDRRSVAGRCLLVSDRVDDREHQEPEPHRHDDVARRLSAAEESAAEHRAVRLPGVHLVEHYFSGSGALRKRIISTIPTAVQITSVRTSCAFSPIPVVCGLNAYCSPSASGFNGKMSAIDFSA